MIAASAVPGTLLCHSRSRNTPGDIPPRKAGSARIGSDSMGQPAASSCGAPSQQGEQGSRQQNSRPPHDTQEATLLVVVARSGPPWCYFSFRTGLFLRDVRARVGGSAFRVVSLNIRGSFPVGFRPCRMVSEAFIASGDHAQFDPTRHVFDFIGDIPSLVSARIPIVFVPRLLGWHFFCPLTYDLVEHTPPLSKTPQSSSTPCASWSSGQCVTKMKV
jgi:hypothetical protein